MHVHHVAVRSGFATITIAFSVCVPLLYTVSEDIFLTNKVRTETVFFFLFPKNIYIN